MFGRQAYKIGDRFRFWGGLVLEAVGGGPGLIDGSTPLPGMPAWRCGSTSRPPGSSPTSEAPSPGSWCEARSAARRSRAGTVVLAAGGFEANAEMRTRYLGQDWELARVRGTPYNTGDGIRMALDIGAQPWGHWSGCHAVQWDLNAPWHGDRKVGDNFQKHSYPLGIIVNVRGERFVDEGMDFRNYTYVRFGREVIRWPRRAAFQIFDQKVVGAASRGVPHPRGHQGGGRHPSRGWPVSSRSTWRASRGDGRHLQRRHRAGRVQSGHQGRQGHPGRSRPRSRTGPCPWMRRLTWDMR